MGSYDLISVGYTASRPLRRGQVAWSQATVTEAMFSSLHCQ